MNQTLQLENCHHHTPQWGTAGAEIKAPAAENLELSKVLSFQAGVGQNIALRASPAAGNTILLICTFPFYSTSFLSFFQTLSALFKCDRCG